MWAQTWSNIGHFIKPYPDTANIDVTQSMVDKGWTPTTMMEKIDEFYQSLGLPKMPKVRT